MMKQITGVFLLLLLMGLGPRLMQDAYAQDFKLGYTDPERIVFNMAEYQDIQQQLQTEAEAKRTDVQGMITSYQEKLDLYQKRQALLTEQRRQESQKELLDLENQIREADANIQQELAQRELELMNPLLERVDVAINEIAKEQGLAMVFRAPALLYVDTEDSRIVDITLDVARKLGIDVDIAEDASSSN